MISHLRCGGLKITSLFVLLICVSGCASMTIYQEADCDTDTKQYAECFADMGYDMRALPSLVKFCESKGKPINELAFREAHSQRLQKNCSSDEGVFNLAFRYPAHLNGPAVCSKQSLTTDPLKTAAEDGQRAGLIYGSLADYDKDIETAKKYEEDASHDFFAWGFNKLLRSSSEDEKKRKQDAENRYREIISRHPKVNGETLTMRLKCTSSGLL